MMKKFSLTRFISCFIYWLDWDILLPVTCVGLLVVGIVVPLIRSNAKCNSWSCDYYNYTDLELSDSEVYNITTTASKKMCDIIIDDNMESLKEHLAEFDDSMCVCAYLIDEQQQWQFALTNGSYDLSSADCLEMTTIDYNTILQNIPSGIKSDYVSSHVLIGVIICGFLSILIAMIFHP